MRYIDLLHIGISLFLKCSTNSLWYVERFIQEITQKLPSNVGVTFINKKAPRLGEALLKN